MSSMSNGHVLNLRTYCMGQRETGRQGGGERGRNNLLLPEVNVQ